MHRLTLDIIGKYILLLAVIFFFTSCASKDVANEAYAKGDYKKAYSIWKKWADRGFPSESLKVANLYANDTIKVTNRYKKIISLALKSYKNGNPKASLLLEKTYFYHNDIKNALYWFKKSDLTLSNEREFNVHLMLIKNYISNYREKIKYLNLIEEIANNGNTAASNSLGKFFLMKDAPFFNIKKSELYYKKAYSAGNIKAGVQLALLYIKYLNKEEKGLKLLMKLANRDNGQTAYKVANILYANMFKELNRINQPCITFHFKKPEEFYRKKSMLIALRDKYMKLNVVPWYKYSYKRGYIYGMLKLIQLDITYDNFHKKRTFSDLDLKQAIKFLKANREITFRAKLILAQIYENYPKLKRYKIAPIIYNEYKDINETDAIWHLYQYAERFQKPSQNNYLHFLLKKGFEKAYIEKAYQDIITKKEVNKNIKVLQYFGRVGYLNALKYLSSYYNTSGDYQKGCALLKKICHIETGLDAYTDIKIGSCYEYKKDYIKAATIYKFYSDQNNSKALFNLSKIYATLGDQKKEINYIKKAKDVGNIQAEIKYNTLILNGSIDGDAKSAVSYIKRCAKQNNIDCILTLADGYASGIYFPFSPYNAIYYYKKAINLGAKKAYLKIALVYKKIDVDGNMDKNIENVYKRAVRGGVKEAKLALATFYYNKKQYKKALKILLSIHEEKKQKVNYLLYQITGNQRYLKVRDKYINYGPLLLLYSKKYNNNYKKSLLYAFRASMCNTTGSMQQIKRLTYLINNADIIKKIFELANRYPKCLNY